LEGRSFEFFIRDYRAAYTVVTGEDLPAGLTLTHTLLKIKTTLEARRHEWLMVVFDLQYYLEEDIQTGLNSSNLFLPDWSRIMVTSSDVRPKLCPASDVSACHNLGRGENQALHDSFGGGHPRS
jgi:hypothetical protein